MRFSFAPITATILGLGFALPATANPYEGMVDLSVLSGWRAPDGRHVAALRFTLADGWKTYWRAPGDAGVPPVFNWSGSHNLSQVDVTWPTPVIFDQSGMRSIGYTQTLTLPLTITPRDPAGPVRLNGRIDFGICEEICVPVSMVFAAKLSQDDTTRDPQIVAAVAARPWSADEAGVGNVACELSPTEDGLTLSATIDMPRTGGQEVAVIETANPNLWVSEATSTRAGGQLTVQSTIYHVDGKPFALDRSGLRFTVIGSAQAVDIQGCTTR